MLDVTEAAAAEFKRLLAEAGAADSGIRVAASQGGGCCPSYEMDITVKGESGDELLEKDGLKIFVEPTAAVALFDATIDCVDSGDTKGFTINGPSSSCCG